MPQSADQQQAIIIGTLGDEATTLYPSGVLATLLPLIWGHYSETITDAATLYLTAKRDAIDALIGALRNQVQIAANSAQVYLQQKVDALLRLRAGVVRDLDDAKTIAQTGASSGLPPVAGRLTTTAPITPTYPWVDANSERYRGSPYYVSPWGTTYPAVRTEDV